MSDSTDLRRLGQTTQVKRSTLADVKAKIAQLRAQTSEATTAKKYDFKRRLEEIKAEEEATKKARKEAKKAKKEEERKKALGIDEAGGGNKEMEEMMGFASWGAAKGK
jgi:U4/U6.U5 tri-snRNP component SNU23